MSLYLPEQKLGSHSTEGGSSNKFVLKGRQTGSMHRGHTWVFRAESHDTMMAWYEDIKALTEKSPEERNNFVRGHVRSLSTSSHRSSMSSDGGVDDDEDPPFAAATASTGLQQARPEPAIRRPSGGRFPSDLEVNAQRGLQVPLSPLSVSSSLQENSDGRISPSPAPRGDSTEHTHYGAPEINGGSVAMPRTGQGQEFDIATSRAGLPGGYGQAGVQDSKSQNFGHIGGSAGGAREQENNGTPNLDALGHSLNGNGVLLVGQEGRNLASPISQYQHRIALKDEPNQAGLQQTQGPPASRVGGVFGGVPVADGNNGMNYEPTVGMPGSGIPRPGGGPHRNDTAPTISHLHVPGEYPNNTGAGFI